MTIGRRSDVSFREVAEWPRLLVGPMVRRVTSERAWIFIATKQACTAQLLLQAGRRHAFVRNVDSNDTDANTAPPTDGSVSTQPFSATQSGEATPLRRIGANLFVGVISAPIPASLPGEAISYDITFDWGPGSDADGPDVSGFADLGLLGRRSSSEARTLDNAVPLGYVDGWLPSFLTPPVTLDELRLAHASCRKPHGNISSDDPDALPILDQVVAYSAGRGPTQNAGDVTAPYTPPFDKVWIAYDGHQVDLPPVPPSENRERPHQLILTGDQIYADDVAPALLDALSDAAYKLMGWDENPPGITPWRNGFLVAPGWRTRYLSMPEVKELPLGDATDYSQSHLLRFGEWCAMYLFAWSDALWPRNDDNTGYALRSHHYRFGVGKVVEAIEKVERAADRLPAELDPFTALLTRYNHIVAVIKLAGRLGEFEEQTDKIWADTIDLAVQYAGTVPYVRRLVANTATYTMFDDHEITDDWFLSRDVSDRLLGRRFDQEGVPRNDDWWTKDAGPRLLRNGLSAYAIFQHWGNVPDDFAGWNGELGDNGAVATSPGSTLLDLWEPQGPDLRPVLAGPFGDDPPTPGTDHPLYADRHWWESPRPDLELDVDEDPVDDDDDTVSDSSGGADGDPDVDDLPPGIDYGWVNQGWVGHSDTHAADVVLRIDQPPPPDARYDGVDPTDRRSYERFRWDYAIDFPSHRLIALDTRTWRKFPVPANDPTNVAEPPPNRPAAGLATEAELRSVASALGAPGQPKASAIAGLIAAVCDVVVGDDAQLIVDANSVADAVVTLAETLSNAGVEAGESLLSALGIDSLVAEFRLELSDLDAMTGRGPAQSVDDRLWRTVVLLGNAGDLLDASDGSPFGAETSWFVGQLGRYLEGWVAGSVATTVREARQFVAGILDLVSVESGALDVGILDVDLVAIGTALDDLDAVVIPEAPRSFRFFRDGSGHLAPELISPAALEFQVTAPIMAPGDDGEPKPDHPTVLLSPAPIFGHDMVETLQRGKLIWDTGWGKMGGEEWDFEAWNSNPVGVDNLVVAAKALRRCVVLSGDVHYANSSVNVARIRSERVETCYVQLTSSAAKNTEPNNQLLGQADDFLWDDSGRLFVYQFSAVKILTGEIALDPALIAGGLAGTSAGATANAQGGSPPSLLGWAYEAATEKFYERVSKFFHVEQFQEMVKHFNAMQAEAARMKTPMDFARFQWKYFYSPTLTRIAEGFDYLITAPPHSFVAWLNEAQWMTFAVLRDLSELREDWQKKVFGHYLFARDVLRQQIADFYRQLNVDPFHGLVVDRTMLRDIRDPRFTLYGARDQISKQQRNTLQYFHKYSVQSVGHSNVGLVRFTTDPVDGRLGVRHDLLFYPIPKPPHTGQPGEVLGLSGPREDWMGTVHNARFPYIPFDPPRSPYQDVPMA